jgi:hypothetical protein
MNLPHRDAPPLPTGPDSKLLVEGVCFRLRNTEVHGYACETD